MNIVAVGTICIVFLVLKLLCLINPHVAHWQEFVYRSITFMCLQVQPARVAEQFTLRTVAPGGSAGGQAIHTLEPVFLTDLEVSLSWNRLIVTIEVLRSLSLILFVVKPACIAETNSIITTPPYRRIRRITVAADSVNILSALRAVPSTCGESTSRRFEGTTIAVQVRRIFRGMTMAATAATVSWLREEH